MLVPKPPPWLTDGALAHEQTEPAAAAVRDQEAPKGVAELGPMEGICQRRCSGRLGGWNVDAKQS